MLFDIRSHAEFFSCQNHTQSFTVFLGAIYIEVCPGEPFIPIYLIVYGAIILAESILTVVHSLMSKVNRGQSKKAPNEEGAEGNVVGCVLSLFLLGWLIAGGYFR